MTPSIALVFISSSANHGFRFSLDPNNKNEKNLTDFEETKEVWGRQVLICNNMIYKYKRSFFFSRLTNMVKHPYRGLYLGEQTFWKALRITFGNKLASV